MSRRIRGARAGAPRWPLFVVLVAVATLSAGAAWTRAERQRAVSVLTARPGLRVESTEGLLWPTRLLDVAWEHSPRLSVRIARVDLGALPWQRTHRAYGVVIRSRAPLDVFLEEARQLAAPRDLEVMDARLEHTDGAGRTLAAEGVSLEPGPPLDHLRAQSLRAFGTTFRDVHLWASRSSTALQLRLAREANDARAPRLNVARSAGEGVEWGVEVPSQPFPEWANRMGLSVDESWAEAIFVGIGSVIVPDSPAHRARATFRVTLDHWHRPPWPEAGLLTGRSGAVALRFAPGAEATHAITRVEVAAGLFSLVGSGQLTFGQPNRLTFDALGELSCARLLAHLPASGYRDRVQAYVSEHAADSANATSVRLALAVRAEAPSARPLSFRWHLHAGCGLPELKEE